LEWDETRIVIKYVQARDAKAVASGPVVYEIERICNAKDPFVSVEHGRDWQMHVAKRFSEAVGAATSVNPALNEQAADEVTIGDGEHRVEGLVDLV
jgi:hypothetical protein